MVEFAKHGDAYLRDVDDRKKKVKQLLWGDFLDVEETDGEWFRVKWGKDRYWVRD